MASEPPRPASRLRRAARIGARVAAALLGVVALVVLALHTRPARGWVARRIEASANRGMVGTLSIGELDYTLFGGLAIRKVVLRDAQGAEVASVEALSTAPAWASLLGDRPRLADAKVRGVRLHVVVAADGTTNLDKLKKPKGKGPPKLPPKPPSAGTHAVISAFAIDDVRVIVDRDGGARGELVLDHTEGSLAIASAERAIELTVPKLSASLALDAAGRGGLAVRALETAASVKLVAGAGDVSVGPTTAKIEIASPGASEPPRGFPLSIAPLRAHIGGSGDVSAELGALDVGALALHAVELHGHTAKGSLAGEQKASIAGIKIDAEKLNALVGKRVLARDVDLEIGAAGPADKLGLTATLSAGEDVVHLRGELDVHDGGASATGDQRPAFGLHLDAADLDTSRVAGADLAAPGVKASTLSVDVRGHIGRVAPCDAETPAARCPPELDARAEVIAEDVAIAGGATLDHLDAHAHVEKGELTVDDVTARAFGEQVRASGSYTIATRAFHAEVAPSGRGEDAIAALHELGIEAPKALRTLIVDDGALVATFDGTGDGPIHATLHGAKVGAANGKVDVDADADLVRGAPHAATAGGATAAGPDIRVERAHATLTLANVDPSTLAPAPLPVVASLNGRVDVDVTSGAKDVDGAADPKGANAAAEEPSRRPDVHAKAALTARVRSRRDPHGPAVVLEVHAETVPDPACAASAEVCARAKLHVKVSPDGRRAAVVAIDADAPIGAPKDIADRRIDVHVDVAKVALAEVARLASSEGDRAPRGEIELHAHVTGTPRRPAGVFEGELTSALLSTSAELQRARVHGRIAPHASGEGRIAVEATLEGWLRGSAADAPAVTGTASVDAAPFAARAGLRWTTSLDVAPTEIANLPITAERRAGVAGRAEAHLRLSGTQDDVAGEAKVSLSDLTRAGKGPLGVAIAAVLGDERTQLDVDVRAKGEPVFTASGRVGVAGKGLLAAGREGRALDPDVDLALAVPDGSIANLAALAPGLARWRGRIHGSGRAQGKASSLDVKLATALDGFATLDGAAGRASLDIAASKSGATLAVGVGHDGQAPGLVFDAKLPLAGGKGPLGLPELVARARADDVDLRAVVPAFMLEGRDLDLAGRLSCDLSGAFSVKPSLRGVELKAEVKGPVDVKQGRVVLPQKTGAPRVFDRVELALESDAGELRIARLAAHEVDAEKPTRTLEVKGSLGLDDLAVGNADLRVVAHDWLVTGAPRRGQAEPTHATLSADVRVRGTFDQPKKVLNVRVASLRIEVPKPADRGRLRAVARVSDVTSPASPRASVDERGWDVHVELENPAELVQAPLHMQLRGGVDVAVREATRTVRGKLDLVNGRLALGDRPHALIKGSVRFDDAHPNGFLDMHFGPFAITGALGAQRLAKHGDGDAVVFDAPAVDDAGRARVTAVPGEGDAAELPQHDDVYTLAYLAVYLPHLLLLDRLTDADESYEAGVGSAGLPRDGITKPHALR